MNEKRMTGIFLLSFDILIIIGCITSVGICVYGLTWLNQHSVDLQLMQKIPFDKELLSYFLLLFGLWTAISLYGIVLNVWNFRDHFRLYKKLPITPGEDGP